MRDDDIHVTPLYELNRRCGTKIQVKSDFSKYTHNLVQQHKHWSIDSGCDSVMTGIGYLCDRDDAEKREVQSRVKVINCVWGTETHPKASDDMRLENGVFTFFLDTKPSDDKNAHYNVDQFTLHFMEDKLREE